MCVIIQVDRDVMLDLKTLHKCWEENNHGAGIMWYESGGTVRAEKGIMRLKDLVKAIKPLNGKHTFAIHLRWCTSGGRGAELTHPFKLHGGFVMHNGTLSDPPKFWEGSDSSYYARCLEAVTPPDLGHIQKYRDYLDTTVTGQRFLFFLPSQPEYKPEYGKRNHQMGQILYSGEWTFPEKGIMFSNMRWQSGTTTRTLKDTAWESEEYAAGEYISLNLTEHTLSLEEGHEKAKQLSEKIGHKVWVDELSLQPSHPLVVQALSEGEQQCPAHTGA